MASYGPENLQSFVGGGGARVGAVAVFTRCTRGRDPGQRQGGEEQRRGARSCAKGLRGPD